MSRRNQTNFPKQEPTQTITVTKREYDEMKQEIAKLEAARSFVSDSQIIPRKYRFRMLVSLLDFTYYLPTNEKEDAKEDMFFEDIDFE